MIRVDTTADNQSQLCHLASDLQAQPGTSVVRRAKEYA